jgi:Condensation domain
MICRAPSLVGRLNAFQRVMLQWSELHPYNAAHTYRLSGPLSLPSLQQAIRDALDHNGLGVAEIDPDGVWYRHEADDSPHPPEIEVVAGEELPEDLLAAHIARELNRPFERPCCQPFRFSVVDGGPTSHYVSLIYDHWAADSVGARLVMRHVLGRYLGLDIPENAETLDLYPGTYREVFAHRLQGHHLAWPMLRSMRSWLDNRSTWRVAYASARQMAVGYALYRVRPGTVRQVCQFARDNGASVNDVFLAALCRAMAPFLPRRSSKAGAHDMTLGTIVDTRADASEDLSESLGTFLGYYLVRVAGDGKVGLDELARRIAAATRVKKQQRSYLDSAVNLRMASAIWPRLKPENRAYFARRALPLTAGISNVHLRGTWIERQGAGRILDFHRAVSNGPALPLVISPTTIRDQMNIAVSYRVTGFARSKIDGIMQSFVEQLETLGGQIEARVRPRATCAA